MSRRITDLSGDFVVPSKVVAEIRKGFLARKIESIEESLNIVDPDPESRDTALKGARETGDLESLSDADIDVIAVAVMIGGTVISDDFAVQNTCTHLGIPCQSSTEGKIRREIKWIYRCTGCRKKYRTYREQCAVCGHELKKFPASSRDI